MDRQQCHRHRHRSIIFLLFMSLWIIYGILNQYNNIHSITFDPTTVVWCQELLKIILSLLLFFLQDGGLYTLCNQVKEHAPSMLIWYLIPAGLYAAGDVLTYILLRSFDPATLHLLGEMKLCVTAIVHQCLFQKMLNRWHWVALIIITAGCIIKAVDSLESTDGDAATADDNFDEDIRANNNTSADNESDASTATGEIVSMPHPTFFNFALIGVQIMITTFAGVFNEKLLKEKQFICINLQNLCLYINGMMFLTLGMLLEISEHNKPINDVLSPSSLQALFSQPSILFMAITMSVAGVVTSRFLKVFDSIRKSVAVALVVVSLPLSSRVLFGTPITVKMIVSIVMVIAGMQLYSSQPAPRRRVDQKTDEVDYDDNEEEDLMANDDARDREDETGLFLPAIANHTPDGTEKYASVLQQELPERVQTALVESV
jgi:UDP-sugar transporter A1/2/3